MNERCRHARINAAAQPEDNTFIPNLSTDAFHGLVDVVVHRPVLPAAADLVREIGDDLPAMRRVSHFRMKLQAEHLAIPILDSGKRGVLGDGNGPKACRQFGKLVPMRVPHLQRFREVREKRAETILNRQRSLAVFAFQPGFHLP